MNEEFNEPDYLEGKRPNYFESPESIARHILEHQERNSEAVNSDSPRANLNPSELRTARVMGDMIALLEHAEKVCGWDLSDSKELFKDCLSTTNVPSRSKDGFAIVLSKTDRRIQTQEATQFAGEIAQHFNEDTEEGLLSKIPLFGGLFKKKPPVGANNG
jgi:hypothetical protein